MVVEQNGCERVAHVPFEIVGEHAQEDMGAHAIRAPVEDRPDFEFDRLEAAEGALDPGEAFVGARPLVGGEFGRHAGAQHVDAVEPASASIAPWLRVKPRASSVMVRVKCLATLRLSKAPTARPTWRRRAAAPVAAGACDASLDGELACSVASSNSPRLRAAFLGERRIAADHQALAGKSGLSISARSRSSNNDSCSGRPLGQRLDRRRRKAVIQSSPAGCSSS